MTTQALDRYVRVRGKHADAKGPWLWRAGRAGLTTAASARCSAGAREAGIGDIHAHLFRHTAAHELAAAGMGDSDLMRLMSWRSRTMLTRYGASAAAEQAIAAHRRLSPAEKLYEPRVDNTGPKTERLLHDAGQPADIRPSREGTRRP